MRKLTLLLTASTLIAAGIASPASAGSFNPFHVVRDAVDIGLDTAERAVDLGIAAAEDVGEEIEDAVTPDNCRPGERYKGRDGKWHTCR